MMASLRSEELLPRYFTLHILWLCSVGGSLHLKHLLGYLSLSFQFGKFRPAVAELQSICTAAAQVVKSNYNTTTRNGKTHRPTYSVCENFLGLWKYFVGNISSRQKESNNYSGILLYKGGEVYGGYAVLDTEPDFLAFFYARLMPCMGVMQY